ncbi:MAG: hypothetical protein U9R57_02210 [Thermodesulfobacteriota bacterium]|nr:hypothetical protein [Thermodesulfobacteriota bacterium]
MDLKQRGLHAESCPDTDTILNKLPPILQKNKVVAILSKDGFDTNTGKR